MFDTELKVLTNTLKKEKEVIGMDWKGRNETAILCR